MTNARIAPVLALVLVVVIGCGNRSDKNATSRGVPQSDSAGSATMSGSMGSGGLDTVHAVPGAPQDAGAINIVLHSEGEPPSSLNEFVATLLLVDPRGRRTGLDPAKERSFNEIPRAWYDDEAIEDPEEEGSGVTSRVLEITAPEPGTYQLQVRGTGRGTYDLSIRGYDSRLNPSGQEFGNVEIEPGTVHTYSITFDKASGVKIAR